MAKIDFNKLTIAQIQDYLEAVWKGEILLTVEEEQELLDHLNLLKHTDRAGYMVIWILLATLIDIDGEVVTPITGLWRDIPVPNLPGDAPTELLPDPSAELVLVWFTKEDDRVCEICAPLHGKIVGEDIPLEGIRTHPGCRCEIREVPRGRRAMERIGMLEAGAIRAIKDGKKRILEVLAAPFGSPNRKDKLGQFLSARTDYMIGPGDRRPLMYFHGFSPRARKMDQPMSIGVAEMIKVDSKGLWMRAELDDSELSDRTWASALEGNARASTGSVNYLERHNEATGEVLCWPIAELSVFDGGDDRVPVSDDAVVLPLRSLFDERSINLPDNFEAGEDKRGEVDSTKRNLEEKEMDKKEFEAMYAAKKAEEQAEVEKEAALRAKIEKELKETPNYRATFNVNTIDDKEARKDAVKEENFAYTRALIEDARAVAGGGMPRNAMRVTTPLEETEADEIQSMVPDDMYNQIHALLGKYSLVDKLSERGLMTIYNTDKLIFNVPTEVTAMTTMSDIAEAGAYTENSPEFVNTAITMQKVGNFISVTEEALEDQNLFQQWLVKACAKAIALAKNLDLHVLCEAIAGTTITTTDVITDAEMLGCYYGLDQEYRDGAAFIMNDATLAYIRAMLVATPRAYGEFGFNPMSMGEMGEALMNKPVYTNSNWVATVGGTDNTIGVTFANFDEAIFWVERKKLSIFVDPYSTKLSAGTVNFLPSARYAGATVNAAAVAGIENKS